MRIHSSLSLNQCPPSSYSPSQKAQKFWRGPLEEFLCQCRQRIWRAERYHRLEEEKASCRDEEGWKVLKGWVEETWGWCNGCGSQILCL